MNLIDKVVSFFDPIAGVKRARARTLESVYNVHQRRYEAASISRRTADWNARSTSANTEIFDAATLLRNRSRDLSRNNPHAKKATVTLVTNVVGSGIKPSVTVTGNRTAKQTKKLWREWADSTQCDFERRKNFAGIQSMVMRAVVESGECFVRKIRDKDAAPIPLRLQVLECDHLDTYRDGVRTPDGGVIKQGIELDRIGRRVAYWMFPEHPGENQIYMGLTSVRIPAGEILHIYHAERPGQLRGVPVGVSAMLRLKSIDEYDDAEIMRKKVAACFGAFVNADPNSVNPANDDKSLFELEHLEPGTIQYLRPGETVQLAAPPPSDGYGEFTTTALRAIASGYGVTYEAMTGDLSNVNFSSGRMGWIEMGNIVSEYQEQMMIPVLCSGVWEWFVQTAAMTGVKVDPVASWTTPRRPMLDPVKETKGLSEKVRNGFTSWQDAVREQGDDPDILAEELSADYNMFVKLGFMLSCDPRFDPNRVKAEAAVNKAKKPPGNT